MRVHAWLCLALGGLAVALGEGQSLANDDEQYLVENEHLGAFGLGDRHPIHKSECTDWVGVEVIVMVDFIDDCPLNPEDLLGQQTATRCVSTLSRSICATPTPERPYYPCVFGTLSSSELVTVTVTSCTADTNPTQTLTLQMCCTCSATVYTTAVSGYTAGAPCHDCTPYSSLSSSISSVSPESSCTTDDDMTTTTTTTVTAATTVLAHTETTTTTTFLSASPSESESGCPCAGISTTTSTSTGTSTSSGYWPTGGTTYTTSYSTTTLGAPYETTTEGAPFTGGGMQQIQQGVGGGAWMGIVGWVVVGVWGL
ncbi:uncharacterized protein C8A04DRAFT_29316 [Dichotomopilus funicola]|uniref:Uncharacterized protein n=1 Tax=Dichotomopilus funicola TaxID=1934379 RepID=A0AAN6V1E0_9PEZI|nr:hypothetical protein C8A04DRAFT_29316 [Dichotomopilus funicola]